MIKKLFLSIGLMCAAFMNAQENWINVEGGGFMQGATFRTNTIFQNRIYVAGDTSFSVQPPGSVLYSSPSGDNGTFVEEVGIKPVFQAGTIVTGTSNNSYLFLASQVKYDTTGGVTGNLPQVYRFDGTTYTQHGVIDYSTLPPDNQIPSGNNVAISAMALYSPTGSNDTVYAFEQTTSGMIQKVSVFKAPSNVTNPTWINCTNFSYSSGISRVYDAQVWHNKLYIAVNSSLNGGMILRTANGADWDTVATGASLSSVLGANSFNDYFTALQIYNDTLVATVFNSYNAALVYTADSLTVGQTWSALIDSVGSSIMTNNVLDNIVDMTVGDGKLWILGSANFASGPRVFVVTKNANNKDTLLTASNSTGLESGMNYANEYRMSYFNNSVYAVGHSYGGARISNPNGRNSSGNNPSGTGMNAGNIWRFTTVNPVASYVDSAFGGGYCAFNTINFTSTSTNAATADWYVDGSLFNSGLNVSFNPNGPGIYNIMMIAYNGTNQSLYTDTAYGTITIYDIPHIDTVWASKTTVCQGEPDTLYTKVHGGTTPYNYTWYNVQDNLSYPGDSVTVIQLYVVPTPSPYVYSYVTVKDANGCVGSGPYTTLYLYVNPGDSLSGTIIDTLLNPVSAGQVFLYKKQVNNMGIEDTVVNLDPTGKYNFPSLYFGDYYVKAVADTNNPLYKTAVPTYYSNRPYGHAYQWDSALVLLQHGCTASNNSGNDIKIIQIPNMPPSGLGTITGHLSESISFGARYSGPNSPMGAPLKGVDIKLGKNPGGSPAARTTSDTSGNYSFTNVLPGNYKIYVDIPNYGMDSVRLVTIDSLVPTLSVHNDYYVDSTMVRVVPIDSVATAICVGDSIMLGGAYQHNAGTYEDILQTAQGYDSLVVTKLTLKSLPTLTVTASTYTVCSGSAVTLTANGATSFVWSANAGSAATSTATINPTAADVYTVTGTTNGCTDIKTVSVAVNQLPTPTISSNTPCVNQTLNLTSGGGTSYSWSGPNSYSSSTQNPGIAGATAAEMGIYTVTVTDANACVNTATVNAVVNPLPVVTPTGATVCVNGTINLNVNNAGVTYSWSGPNAYSSNSQNPTITGAATNMAGSYVVTVTDANGCVNANTAQVTVNALPVVTTSGATVCVNSTIGLGSNGGSSYSWAGPNAYSSVSQNPSINNAVTNMSGDYTVTVTDANGCVNSNTAQVLVNSLPTVVANTSLDTVCSGNMVTLTGGGAASYTWSTGVVDGVSFAPTATDTYTVSGSDANSCVNTATVTVAVKTCIGIRQYGTAGLLNVYPVPAGNTLFVEVERNALVKMYNIAGQVMLEQYVNAGKNEINTTNLPSGAYDLIVNSEGKTTYVKVMISK